MTFAIVKPPASSMNATPGHEGIFKAIKPWLVELQKDKAGMDKHMQQIGRLQVHLLNKLVNRSVPREPKRSGSARGSGSAESAHDAFETELVDLDILKMIILTLAGELSELPCGGESVRELLGFNEEEPVVLVPEVLFEGVFFNALSTITSTGDSSLPTSVVPQLGDLLTTLVAPAEGQPLRAGEVASAGGRSPTSTDIVVEDPQRAQALHLWGVLIEAMARRLVCHRQVNFPTQCAKAFAEKCIQQYEAQGLAGHPQMKAIFNLCEKAVEENKGSTLTWLAPGLTSHCKLVKDPYNFGPVPVVEKESQQWGKLTAAKAQLEAAMENAKQEVEQKTQELQQHEAAIEERKREVSCGGSELLLTHCCLCIAAPHVLLLTPHCSSHIAPHALLLPLLHPCAVGAGHPGAAHLQGEPRGQEGARGAQAESARRVARRGARQGHHAPEEAQGSSFKADLCAGVVIVFEKGR